MAQQNLSSERSQTALNEGEIRYPLSEISEVPMPEDQLSPANSRWIYGRPGQIHEDTPPEGELPDTGMGAPGAMPICGMNGGFTGGVSSDFAQSQRMRNPVELSTAPTPSDGREAYMASMRSLLARNVGFFVVCTFVLGNGQSVTWQGVLHTVGSDYLVLYQPDYERYISCDLYSLKFTQFHNARGVPYAAASRSWEGQRSW